MDYAALDDITWEEAQRLLDGEAADQIDALLRCGFYAVMPRLTIDACRDRVGPANPTQLRRAAIVCLGHLVRRTGVRPPGDVVELVRDADSDSALSGAAVDFFDDLAMFAPPPT